MLCSASPPPTSGVPEVALQEDSSGSAQAGPSFPWPFQRKTSAPEPCPLQLKRLVVEICSCFSVVLLLEDERKQGEAEVIGGFHMQRALKGDVASLKGGNFHWKGGLPSLISNTSALPVKGKIRNSLGGFQPSWVHVYLLV